MKNWWQSKTLWFNFLTAVVGVVGDLTNQIKFDAKTGAIFSIILVVGNSLLRFLTTQPIGTPKA
jgi:hypothetical protein